MLKFQRGKLTVPINYDFHPSTEYFKQKTLLQPFLFYVKEDYTQQIYKWTSQMQVEKLVIEADDIGQGLLQLISQHRITNLVMGAAADKHYTKYA